MPLWDREDWVGAVVLTLAVGVVVVLVIIALGVTVGDYEPREGSTYAGVVGAVVGAVATYIGSARNRRDRDEE